MPRDGFGSAGASFEVCAFVGVLRRGVLHEFTQDDRRVGSSREDELEKQAIAR